jgi:hypothetical protein
MFQMDAAGTGGDLISISVFFLFVVSRKMFASVLSIVPERKSLSTYEMRTKRGKSKK